MPLRQTLYLFSAVATRVLGGCIIEGYVLMIDWLLRLCRYFAHFCRARAGAAIVGTVVGGMILGLLEPVPHQIGHFLIWILLGIDHGLKVAGAAARGPLMTFGTWWDDPIAVARHRVFVYPVIFMILGYCAARIRELARESRSNSGVSAS
jgi:hypothetical protein